MKYKASIIFTFLFLAFQSQNIYTIAGSGLIGSGGDGGPAINASMDQPWGIAVDGTGNVYFSDYTMSCIRKIDVSGIITTIAGTPGFNGYSGDGGPATSALLNFPLGIAVDVSGNVYIADNGKVRKIDITGVISTFAGAGTSTLDGVPASSALLNSVKALAIDASGNIYLSDGCRVRKIDSSGIITTVAGNGTYGFSGDGGAATSAELSNLESISLDGSGTLYIADNGNKRVRKVNSSGTISTYAGGGVTYGDGGLATSAEVDSPYGVAGDAFGNVYITDGYRTLRKVNSSGIISTVAGTVVVGGYNGSGIPASIAILNFPEYLTTDASGNIYFCDRDNHRVREICVASCLMGVNEISINDNGLKIFPNPVSKTLFISSETNEFEKSENLPDGSQVEIINYLGQTVFYAVMDSQKLPFKNEIDVSQLSNGCYLLKLTTAEKHQFHSKFIKEYR